MVALSFLISLMLFYFLLGGLPSNKPNSSDSYLNLIIDQEKKGERNLIEEIEWRFGASSRMSVGFLRMYDRGDEAGLNPITHSSMGIVPRFINENKPYPSTLDGDDPLSGGAYLLYREVYGYHHTSMVEFSTGSHAYWELGWIGVIFLSLISGIYISISTFYFQRFGIASIVLVFSLFKPFGYMEPKIWVSDIPLQIYQIILPFFFIYFFWRAIFTRIKLRNDSSL